MKPLLALLFLALAFPAAARADCYVEYKAKQDSPLRLHYGIALLPGGACPDAGTAAETLRPRLSQAGWTLLNIVGRSPDTPDDRQRADAGEFYLRF